MNMTKHKIIVAVTGASGSIYAKVLFDKLQQLKGQIESVGVLFSDNARTVWEHELGNRDFEKLPFTLYEKNNFMAPFASGSAKFDLKGAGTALFGTALVFCGAYLLEKTKGDSYGAGGLRGLVRLLAMLPMAVPGLVLGLGYIFFFNAVANPLNGLYHTLTLLTLCTIVHFYTTGHLTAVTALKSLDSEFEAVSASLKVPFFKTFWRVTLPICTPALIDIARYFFINAMTTISAVVFLYSPDTKVASIAILNLDEAGEIAAAAAMAVLIGIASTIATLLFMLLGWWVNRSTQAWRITSR